MRRFPGLLALSLAACGAHPTPRPIGNVAGEAPGETAAVVDLDRPVGALALGTMAARGGDAPYWIPVTQIAPVMASTTAGVLDGTAYTVVPADGSAAVTLTAQPATAVPYGCDGGSQEMVPLAGAAVAPGLVWVLPAVLPPTWQPRALPLDATEATATRHRWRAGPLALELAKVDDRHATLTIDGAGGRPHVEHAERYFMDGADEGPLELTNAHVPGIPRPAAVFAVAPAGPFLVVLDRSGYEGVAFETLLVERDRARPLAALGLGLYFCAF